MWPYVGDMLWGPATDTSVVIRARCSRCAPYVGCLGPSVVTVTGPVTVGTLVCMVGPGLVDCQVLSQTVAASVL